MKNESNLISRGTDKVPTLCSQRWILAYIGFLGVSVVNSIRVNMSVAIVCMVKAFNETSTNGGVNFSYNRNHTCALEVETDNGNDTGELDWDSSTRSMVLASFFYGYIFTQVPGGWLADRYGARRVLGYSILTSSVLTMLTPVCARYNVILVYVLRVLLGLFTAACAPAMSSMWGKWAPPLERSKLATLSNAGTPFGTVVSMATSGLLCAYGFDNGWGSIFYVTGIVGIVWSVAWFFLTADIPAKHPRITTVEKEYITSSIEYRTDKKTRNVPWLSMAKSPCLWALIAAHMCDNWTAYTLVTNTPTFMKEVLKFDIKKNGVLSSVPYLCMFVAAIFAGHSADFLRSRRILSTTNTRKLYQSISFIVSGSLLIVTGFTSCEQSTLAVVLLSVAVMCMGFSQAGWRVNHVDFAPRYAGVLYGITNTAATIPGMIAPILAGYLTPNQTPEEWRNVFYVCAAFAATGMVIFNLFASGELQEWAMDKSETIEIEVKPVSPENKTLLEKL